MSFFVMINKKRLKEMNLSKNTALGAATQKDAKIIFISETHEKFNY